MTDIRTWYEQLLAQQAADSYLDGMSDLNNVQQQTDRLRNGANHYSKIAEFAEEDLSATRMTGGVGDHIGMVDDFQATWKIIDHLPNTSSGFSATLLKHKTTGDYTLSFRSTESKDAVDGGDVERDSSNGANGQVSGEGFAWAQIRDMENYYQNLRNGVLVTGGSGTDIAAYLADSGEKLNITGYSLGGHLAQVFALMHADKVGHTHVFNGAGLGAIDGANTAEALGAALRNRVALIEDIMANPADYVANVTDGEFYQLGVYNPGILPSTREASARAIADLHDPLTDNIYHDPLFRYAMFAMPDDTTSAFAVSLGEYFSGEARTEVHGITNIYGHATHDDRKSALALCQRECQEAVIECFRQLTN